MRYLTLDQGSEDWLLWRTKGLGASDAPIIMGVSPWTNPKELLEQKVARWFHADRRSNKNKSAKMLRGIMMEPEAREAYCQLSGNKVEPMCGIHDCLDWMRASYDGGDVEKRLLLEVKCINADDHQTAVGGLVPVKYWPQCQHQLIVAGPGWTLDYFSYSTSSRFKGLDRTVTVPVKLHEPYAFDLLHRETEFWNKVLERVREKERAK